MVGSPTAIHNTHGDFKKEYDDPDIFTFDNAPSREEVLSEEVDENGDGHLSVGPTPALTTRRPSWARRLSASTIGTNSTANERDIMEWHRIHKPPKEIRTVKWMFNAKTTSNLPPSAIFQRVHAALIEMQKMLNDQISFKRIDDYYIMYCEFKTPNAEDSVSFDIEVCKVWLLKLYGVKVKRISGDPLLFKDLYAQVIDLLRL